MLVRNFLRELKNTLSRLISVIVIVAVAVMVFVGLTSIIYNTDRDLADYYEKANVADYWITATSINKRDCREISRIDGVTVVEPRVILEVEDRHDSNVTLQLYTYSENCEVNRPLIMDGTLATKNYEIMLSDEFAKAKGLRVGDVYEMYIPAVGRVLKGEVSALIKNPECMYHVNASTLSPDYSKYGYVYVNEGTISQIMGKNNYTQLCITTEDNINEKVLKDEINAIFQNRIVSIINLKDNTQAYNLKELVDGIEVILYAFPIIFFLIATLIMFSTMSRLIENSRTSIGTLKALGYSDKTILLYYTMDAVIIVILGYILGVLPALQVLTKPIIGMLYGLVDMPPWSLEYSPMSLIAVFVIISIICIGTAVLITRKALAENPAQCMRPKPPKETKKIFLEQIPSVWKKLSFAQKYIVRNVLRNKGRMITCIVGITGCMALILMGLLLNDTVQNNLNLMSNHQHNYDYMVNFDGAVSENQYKHLSNIDGVTDSEFEMTTGVKFYTDDKMESSYLSVIEDEVRLKLMELYGENYEILPKKGIILSEDTAELLEVSPGDTITMKLPGSNKYYKVKIERIIDGGTSYAGRSFWRSLGQDFSPTAAYIETDGTDIEDKLDSLDYIKIYQDHKSVVTKIEGQSDTIVVVVYLLIAFGGILAVVVLYNLGIMSFYEQIRNLATLMVLGFRDKEVKKLVLTENLIFSAFGVLFGIPSGIMLVREIIKAISMLNMQLYAKPISFIIAGILTFGFAWVVNKMLGKKMKNIDMLGALKSVE